MDTNTLEPKITRVASRFDTIATQDVIQKTADGLKERGIEPIIVGSSAEALAKIKELISAGASVMNGASRTLEQIGFVEYLKAGKHGWNNLHEVILAEKDPAKQGALRKQGVLSDFYLGSAHALAQTGQFLVASNSGSQLPHIVFTSPNIIFVVGAQKIVSTLDDAFKRLEEHVIPLEDDRMMQVYKAHTYPSKVVIFNREPAFLGRKVRMIIVPEKLGF